MQRLSTVLRGSSDRATSTPWPSLWSTAEGCGKVRRASAKEKKDVDREEWIEHVVANLTTAVEELFNEHLLEVHPDLFGFYLNFDPADTNAYDPEKLIEGLATCAWCEVHCDVIAEALMLYARTWPPKRVCTGFPTWNRRADDLCSGRHARHGR